MSVSHRSRVSTSSRWLFSSPGALVVGGGADDKSGSMPRLLRPCLRIKSEPNNVARLWGVATTRYQRASLPTGLPTLTSACEFFAVIPLTRSPSAYSICSDGSTTMRPRVTVIVTFCSGAKLACLMIASGKRSAGLLPHLRMTDSIIDPFEKLSCVYIVETCADAVKLG